MSATPYVDMAGLGHDCPQCGHKMIDHYSMERIPVRGTAEVYTWCCDTASDCDCETVTRKVAA